jgi:hypothetical protein
MAESKRAFSRIVYLAFILVLFELVCTCYGFRLRNPVHGVDMEIPRSRGMKLRWPWQQKTPSIQEIKPLAVPVPVVAEVEEIQSAWVVLIGQNGTCSTPTRLLRPQTHAAFDIDSLKKACKSAFENSLREVDAAELSVTTGHESAPLREDTLVRAMKIGKREDAPFYIRVPNHKKSGKFFHCFPFVCKEHDQTRSSYAVRSTSSLRHMHTIPQSFQSFEHANSSQRATHAS